MAEVPSSQRDPSSFVYKRVVGGKYATLEDWPWMANIRFRESLPFCGASIITDEFVLSSAVCISAVDTSKDKIHVGDLDTITVEREWLFNFL